MSARPVLRHRDAIGFDFRRDPELPVGQLPHDARMRLIAANKVGSPGSLTRQKAISRAYSYIEATYPQYLKQGA